MVIMELINIGWISELIPFQMYCKTENTGKDHESEIYNTKYFLF